MRKFLVGLAASAALTMMTGMMGSLVLAQHVDYAGLQCMSNCTGDVGPKKDTAAVRAAMLEQMQLGDKGPFDLELGRINAVHVVGDYALLNVDNPAMGANFAFKRRAYHPLIPNPKRQYAYCLSFNVAIG